MSWPERLLKTLYLTHPVLRKRAMFTAFIMLVVSSAAALVTWQQLRNERIDLISVRQDAVLSAAAEQINRELGDIRTILDLMYLDSAVRNYLAADDRTGTKAVSRRFVDMARAMGNLLQIRWLDAGGNERLRVNNSVFTTEPEIVPESGLQNKADRYYFSDAMKVIPPDIYLSPIDLNIEQGKVVEPYEPTLRAGLQTGITDSLASGVLLINYDLRELLNSLHRLSGDGIMLQLTGPDGYWFVHENPAREWGRDLGNRDLTLRTADPSLWQSINSSALTLGQLHQGSLLSSRQLSLTENGNNRIFLLAKTPADVINAIDMAAFWPALAVFLILLSGGSYLILYDLHNMDTQNRLTHQLEHEKQELETANINLDNSLKEQQLLQDELVETRKLSALGMMVAGVAHELNTPIGGAVMMTSSLSDNLQELKKSYDTGLSRQALVDYIDSSGEALELLRSNLTRAKSGVESFKRLAIDRASDDVLEFRLKQVTDDLIRSLNPVLNQAQVEVVTDIPDDLLLKGYPGIISQVVQNLILNSIKHGFGQKRGGQIRIMARPAGNDKIRIDYQDNGRGISPDIQNTLFDPFVTTARGEGSTGLGLHLVHQWVTQLMYGSIHVKTPGEGGLAFVILLPRVIAAGRA